MDSVKTTIDIPDRELKDAMRHTGAKTKREAVVTALKEFNRRRRVDRLIAQLGTFDGFIDADALQKLRAEG